MTRAEWFKLPMALRRRWWRETDYGRLAPSAELLRAVEEALHEQQQAAGPRA